MPSWWKVRGWQERTRAAVVWGFDRWAKKSPEERKRAWERERDCAGRFVRRGQSPPNPRGGLSSPIGGTIHHEGSGGVEHTTTVERY